jgi:nicotinamidase-related amidase
MPEERLSKRALLGLGLLAVATWLPAVGAQDEERSPVTPALIVIDVQNRYVPMMDEGEQGPAVRMINGAIWQFRQVGLPVIRVYHTDPQWGPEPGSEDFEFLEGIIVQDDDPRVVKNHASAFVETELDSLLGERGVNAVFLCGLSATGCVLATYFGALERGYDVFMVEGALLSPSADHTETIKDIVNSVGWSELELILRAVAG